MVLSSVFRLGLFVTVSATALLCDTVYTDSYSFQTAVLSSSQQVEDFSSLTPGDTIAPGQTVDGITYNKFTLSGGDTSGVITDVFNSFSGNSLGANHPAAGAQYFFGNEGFQISFATPVTALGVFLNVALNSGTFGFTTDTGGVVTTGSTAYDQSTFVFAGIVGSTPFTTATISSSGTSAAYTVPEIVSVSGSAAPEPSSWLLSAAGITGFLLLASRKIFGKKA